MKDKVALERNRINQRVGWQARLHQANAPETSSMLTSCPVGGAGYLSNADRFHTDTVGEEYLQRQEQNRKKQAADEFRRNMTVKREEDRWSQAETKARLEEERVAKFREEGLKAKKNQSNTAYDILTLQYAQSQDGEHQRFHDDMVRYRAGLRSNALVTKGDTRVGYNIISGESRPPLPQPERPGQVLSNQPPSARVDRRLINQAYAFYH
eukprot:scaffold96_cov167-Ochromonas_danica.AAC.21